jgi:hypothetical protein
MILISLHAFSEFPVSPVALATIVGGLASLATAVRARAQHAWTAAGTLLLTCGLGFLVQPNAPKHVHPITALVVGPALGLSTVWLGRIARRARRNKLRPSRDRAAASGFTG